MEDILSCINALKNTARTGWMQRGISPAISENIASHSYEVALLSLYISERAKREGIELKPDKVVIMALLHDLPECISGDVNPFVKNSIGSEKKHELESEALKKVLNINELLGIYTEYAERSSLESLVVELSDKLSTIIQAKRYSKLGYDLHEMIFNLQEEVKKLLERVDERLAKIVREIL
ncbi:MAG: HD domain-containing protein [Desulfurococcales archaeon]|jgi:putative hydrolase of HD superfamily|nr:HD domain-containing protein [Desulfurococcales archaeon]